MQRFHALTAIVLIALGVVFFRIAGTLASNSPVDYEDIAEHFKYGSIGAEENSGLPYWIWRVLPDVCESALPKRPTTTSSRRSATVAAAEVSRARRSTRPA